MLPFARLRPEVEEALLRATEGKAVGKEDAHALIRSSGKELLTLMFVASMLRERHKGPYISYSRNVFIPLTNLCKYKCGYCAFAKEPGDPSAKLMAPSEVVEVAEAGRRLGCKEALFTTGEKPEDRYPEARQKLRQMGYRDFIEYLRDMCSLTVEKAGLLPHSNPGAMTKEEMAELRDVNISMGLMLESISERLLEEGGPHELAPGKHPKIRLRTIEEAGQLKIAFTTGILIGIGEALEERVDSLLAIKALNDRYGHVQEVTIQNFHPFKGTSMEHHCQPSMLDILRTTAVARLIFQGETCIQAPANKTQVPYQLFPLAGSDDWGGVSPITLDYVNPEAPRPEIEELRRLTEEAGFILRERLAVHPKYVVRRQEFLPEPLKGITLAMADEEGYAKEDGRSL